MKRLLLLAFFVIGCSNEDPCEECITAQAPTSVTGYDPNNFNREDVIVLESIEATLPRCYFNVVEYKDSEGSPGEYFSIVDFNSEDWLRTVNDYRSAGYCR